MAILEKELKTWLFALLLFAAAFLVVNSTFNDVAERDTARFMHKP